MKDNIYSQMQHWLGKMQDAIGINAIVAISSSTKMGMLNIMISWFAKTKDEIVCKPFLAKWTIADIAKMGQDDITGATIKAALEWKRQQSGLKNKEIEHVAN